MPELLSVRAELTNQTEQVGGEHNDDQPFDEFLILNKSDRNDTTKPEMSEVEPVTSGGCIEILDQTILNAAPTSNNNPMSYNISKNSVLVVTADGNYMIASLEDDSAKKPIEIKVAAPQVEQVIILNTNDIQFAEMEVDCQEIEHTVDEKW